MSAREEGAPKLNRWSKPEYERLNAADGMPPQTHSGIRAVRGIPLAAADGTVLLTDHVFPTQAKDSVVLIRTPYGRNGLNGVARMIAERGHHVVIRACRGTDGSGTPPFEPMVHEASDGQTTLAWLRAQPWATGMVQSFGASYIGLTQWAEGNGPLRPDAMVVSLSSRRFDEAIIYPGGGFCMETAVVWDYSLDLQTRPLPAQLWRLWRAQPRVRQASLTVPPEDAARVAVGRESPFFRSWMAHSEPGDPWWEPLHFSPHPEDLPPVTILAGWQDLFLQGGFRDFADLTAAGTTVRLIAGDWTHHEGNQGVSAVRALLQQFDDPGLIARSAAVSLTTSGVATERTFSQWPPPATPRTWFPTAGGSLADAATNPRVDFFVRLTDVDAAGVSHSVTDVFQRMTAPDAAEGPDATLRRVRLTLAPTGHRFAAGHRVRLQISSGAHPLHLRNAGTADPLHDFSQLIASEQTIVLGGDAAATLTVPVVS